MPASIRSTLRYPPAGAIQGPIQVDVSRDDLQKGYQVNLESVNVHTTYAWTLVSTPTSPDGTTSTAGLSSTNLQTTDFIVDLEGAYLIRLVVDAGLPTEDTKFFRFRYKTRFADLSLVAAGERRDQNGVVPTDATLDGWANNQNRNLLLLLSQVRRQATTGRSLYVDANRGRDSSNAIGDPTVTYELPGSDTADTVDDVDVTARSHGDFSTINEAITYAAAAAARGEPAPSGTDPYFIFIKPGFYNEDLSLQPWIYLVGDTPAALVQDAGVGGGVIVRAANSGGGTHEFSPTLLTDLGMLFNITLENVDVTAEAVLKQDEGTLILSGCRLWQQGNGAAQGPAYAATDKCIFFAYGTEFLSEANVNNDRCALYVDGTSTQATLHNCTISGRTGVYLNPSVNAGVYGVFEDCTIEAGAGYGVRAFPASLTLRRSVVTSISDALNIVVDEFGAGAGASSLSVLVEHSSIQQLSYDSAATAGTTNLVLNSVALSGSTAVPVVLPSGALTSYTTGMSARSLGYVPDWEDPTNVGVDVVPAAAQLGKVNTQDAIDLLARLSNPQSSANGFTLQAAYDGVTAYTPFTVGSGAGRVIDAASGAVQITGAPTLLGPLNTTLIGGLQSTGPIDLGPVVATGQGSEIFLDPNHYGVGARMKLGNAVWPTERDNDQLAIPSGTVFGGYNTASGGPYTLRLKTYDRNDSGTGNLGRVILTGGHVTDGGPGTANAGKIFLEAGHVRDSGGTGDGGTVFLVPGDAAGTGAVGRIQIVDPTTATPGVLTGAGAITNPVGVDGVLYLATPDRNFQVNVTAATTAAALPGLITTATDGVIVGGTGGGGELTLTTAALGTNADLIYVGDSVSGALNAAVGDMEISGGASWVAGTYPTYVEVSCPSSGTLQVHGTVISTGTVGAYTAIDSTDNTYTVLATDDVVGVDTSVGAINVLVALDSTLPAGTRHIIKDEGNNAAVNNIVVTPSAGTIDGAASLTINTNYGAASVYFNGTNWFLY